MSCFFCWQYPCDFISFTVLIHILVSCLGMFRYGNLQSRTRICLGFEIGGQKWLWWKGRAHWQAPSKKVIFSIPRLLKSPTSEISQSSQQLPLAWTISSRKIKQIPAQSAGWTFPKNHPLWNLLWLGPIPKVEGAERSCYFATFSPAPSSCGPAMVRVFGDCAKTARPVLTKGLFSSAAWVTMKWEPTLGSCEVGVARWGVTRTTWFEVDRCSEFQHLIFCW